MISRDLISGLVLAGGRGSRMGGLDKGLQYLDDADGRGPRPLALNAVERLAPQVGRVWISANRHLDTYRGFGVAVVADAPLAAALAADADAGFAGPLAGVLAGLDAVATPYLAAVPCDAPRFPRDLVARLAAALDAAGGRMAIAMTRDGASLRPQPVFLLMHTCLRPALADFLRDGGRGAQRFVDLHGAVRVPFDDAAAFFNANTPSDLALLAAATPATAAEVLP